MSEESVGKAAFLGFGILRRGKTEPFRGPWKQPALKTRLDLQSEAVAGMLMVGLKIKTEIPAYEEDLKMFKLQLVKQGGQTKTVFRPVVLTLALTPEQKQVVRRYTGQIIEQIDLTKEDLDHIGLNYTHHHWDYFDPGHLDGGAGGATMPKYDIAKAKA